MPSGFTTVERDDATPITRADLSAFVVALRDRNDPKTGRTARLGRLDGLTMRPLGLSVSPDGNTVIYPRQVLSRADLMLIENFR